MALYFKSAPAEKIYTIDEFAGVDFTTEPSKVSHKRSPDAKNMIINRRGYVEKRTGYRRVYEGEGKINGIFEYICPQDAVTYRFIHISDKLYKFSVDSDGKIVPGDMVLDGLLDKKSRAFVFGGALYIIGAGYVKISYDEIIGKLCYGFVNKAHTRFDKDDAPVIIKNRMRNKLDGEGVEYNTQSVYKKIQFAYDHYSYNSRDKLYICAPEHADLARVVSVYMSDYGEESYWRLREENYDVKTDDIGMYVKLDKKTIAATSCSCAPYVIVEYNNSVYAPTVVSGRLPVQQQEIGGSVLDANGEVTTNFVPYTGEALEGANLASPIRKVDFYYDVSNHHQYAGAFRFYVGDNKGIGRIWINGKLCQKYYDFNSAGTLEEQIRVINSQDMGFAEIKRSLLRSGDVITIEYACDGEFDVIDHCSIYTLYGGDNDTRAFVSGNEKYRCRDFASGLYDASYFSDLMYTDVGSEESAITGYHKLYGNLIIVKDGVGKDSSQYLRSFKLVDDEQNGVKAMFSVRQGNISYGAVNTSSFKNIGGVPLYLGADGVFAIKGTSVENQNNTVCVSQMVGKHLTGRDALENAVCAQNGGKYYIFIENSAYVCDAENGFEWFYFDSLPKVSCVWVQGKTMYFGTDEGIVYRFMEEDEKNAYYDDVSLDGSVLDAKAIEAVWEMPATTLGEYANYKTVRSCYITCMPHRRSSVKVYYNTNEDYRDWVLGENIDLFSFDDVDFERFTFRTIQSPFVFSTNVKAKNVYVFGTRLVNDAPGEPFGFLAFAIKYRSSKYVK